MVWDPAGKARKARSLIVRPDDFVGRAVMWTVVVTTVTVVAWLIHLFGEANGDISAGEE